MCRLWDTNETNLEAVELVIVEWIHLSSSCEHCNKPSGFMSFGVCPVLLSHH
jgi:Fe-S-cluster-containing dehydrogenase component